MQEPGVSGSRAEVLGHQLQQVGRQQPRVAVLAAGETDPQDVITKCIGLIPDGKPHFYQKHMTQHMLPDIPRDWMAQVTNVFLI